MLQPYSAKQVALECYPCTKWLNGVLEHFLEALPKIEIDIVNKFQFTGLEGLLNHHIDILVTPDLESNNHIHHEAIADYDLVLLTSESNKLAKHQNVYPEQLATQTLLSFPIPLERMDVMTQFLNPANIRPAKIKEIESIDLIIQLVSLNRGVCVLPEWLANYYCKRSSQNKRLRTLKIGKTGIQKKLYLAIHHQDQNISYIQKFINVSKKEAGRLFKSS